MANLKDIKGRINSVKSTQKITNAMKLVSAAKFARANHAIDGSRPYSKAFSEMMSKLLTAAKLKAGERFDLAAVSPFLVAKEERKALVVVFTTDRGLCGGLNSNVLKAADRFVKTKREAGVELEFVACGRRANLHIRKRGWKQLSSFEKVFDNASMDYAQSLTDKLLEYYQQSGFDTVYLVYPHFKSALEQHPTIKRFLSIDLEELASEQEDSSVDLIVEPELEKFLDHLLQRLLYGVVYQVLLNGSASEHGARMTAMDAATSNAKEVIKKLTLQYNRARQAAITTELTEIISGAEALN